MPAHTVYRDDEEVEVSWLVKKLDDLSHFWKVCKETSWLHYFRGNGPGEVFDKEFSGFRKLHDERSWLGQWTIGIKGGLREPMGNFYYRNVKVSYTDVPEGSLAVDLAWPDFVKWRVSQAEMDLDFYAQAGCTCRIGFHCRCPFHHKAQN
jgi:hypothetical protein